MGEKCTEKVITLSGSQIMHGFTLSIFTKLTTAWRKHMQNVHLERLANYAINVEFTVMKSLTPSSKI